MSNIYYGSNVAATTISTADNMAANTTGGTEASKNTTSPFTGASNQYMEVLSQGGSATGQSSLPAPTGKGWLYDSTALEGKTIAAGNWSAIINLKITSNSITIFNAVIRFYKRSGGGVYTSIGSISTSNISITGAKQQVSFANTSMSSVSFSTGDKLYIDQWLQSQTGSNVWVNDTIAFYVSNSATAGVANDMQTTAPAFAGGHLLICDGYGGVFS